TPPTPPARGDRGEGRRERRARGRDSPKPPTLPPTFDEAAARFKARYGIDTTGGENHAERGLATVSNAHAGG
ncbi:MAG: hypothetical protein IJU98_11520, partial [Synergistaceae bacterium]|nr:hypothetical protein [Synergistaceae bacterium]